MNKTAKKLMSDRDIAFWRAYFEISKERVPLVDLPRFLAPVSPALPE